MTNDEHKTKELEQLLRDERALRIRAESRAAEQAEKAAIWRNRAEERAARIERLAAEPKRRRGRRTRPEQTTEAKVEPRVSGELPKSASRLATVRVAAAVAEHYESLLAPFATDLGAKSSSALAEADLVVVDGPNLKSLESADSYFPEWLELQGRQPFVLLADPTTDLDHPYLAHADLVVTCDAVQHAAAGRPQMTLLPSFDPRIENPIGRADFRLKADGIASERDGARVLLDSEGQIVGIETSDLSHPPGWLVAAAARGVPIANRSLSSCDSIELSRIAAAARRWAYRNHTTTQRATAIARRAGLPIRDPQPQVAAIVVSMRPDQAASVLDMLRLQTYRPLSVVVGLHGAQPTDSFFKAIERLGDSLPIVVDSYPKRLSLGECLNRAIESSGAELLAKIDDDDFYGPAHVEDGVHALEYSQAGIVGKGAQFTYVEADDRTVLRRHREQETFIGGSPTGATMLLRRHVWEQVGFPHRPRQVDVLFTRAARHNGTEVYAGSPWEFCYVRSAQDHTWTTPAETFLSGAAERWSGFRPEAMVAPDLITDTTSQ
jgi:hypothetical protein